MAGMNRTITYTFKVYDASGSTIRRFACLKAPASGGVAEIAMPTAVNQRSCGVFADTIADDGTVGVWGQPGDILIVDGDGTVTAGDIITNDADGKATPIPLASTPAAYWCHGQVVEVNSEDDTVKFIFGEFQYEA
jgi:hypothetical protein